MKLYIDHLKNIYVKKSNLHLRLCKLKILQHFIFFRVGGQLAIGGGMIPSLFSPLEYIVHAEKKLKLYYVYFTTKAQWTIYI